MSSSASFANIFGEELAGPSVFDVADFYENQPHEQNSTKPPAADKNGQLTAVALTNFSPAVLSPATSQPRTA